MRILITNIAMKGRSGTETATRDLATGLLAAGEEPVVYSPMLGETANELTRAGVPVVDDLAAITDAPDIIHGHHYVETYQALARFPETRAIFVLHDASAWHDVPPLAPQILRHVAVDLNCRERLVQRYSIPENKVRLILNSFDPALFPAREKLPEKPGRALVFSHYAGPRTFLQQIEAACAALNIPVDVLGAATGRVHSNPGEILGDYDLVFGIARCAIEALACGAAVVLCGKAGLGPLVTMDNAGYLRDWNFGQRMLLAPSDKDLIIAEIKKYNRDSALAVSRYVREHSSLQEMVAQYLSLYREVMAEPLPGKTDIFTVALTAAAQHAARFENLSEALFKGNYCMLLPAHISRHLSLKIVECPRTVASAFHALVEFTNHSSELIASSPPYPVYLSYHWFSGRGETLLYEGDRTAFGHKIAPDQQALYEVAISLPPKSGTHRLRITLVQEGIMWFDRLDPALMAEVDIEVMSGESTDTQPAA